MMLFTNLTEVKVGHKEYSPMAVLKLTSKTRFSRAELRTSQQQQLRLLKRESQKNGFQVLINGPKKLDEIEL